MTRERLLETALEMSSPSHRSGARSDKPLRVVLSRGEGARFAAQSGRTFEGWFLMRPAVEVLPLLLLATVLPAAAIVAGGAWMFLAVPTTFVAIGLWFLRAMQRVRVGADGVWDRAAPSVLSDPAADVLSRARAGLALRARGGAAPQRLLRIASETADPKLSGFLRVAASDAADEQAVDDALAALEAAQRERAAK